MIESVGVGFARLILEESGSCSAEHAVAILVQLAYRFIIKIYRVYKSLLLKKQKVVKLRYFILFD